MCKKKAIFKKYRHDLLEMNMCTEFKCHQWNIVCCYFSPCDWDKFDATFRQRISKFEQCEKRFVFCKSDDCNGNRFRHDEFSWFIRLSALLCSVLLARLENMCIFLWYWYGNAISMMNQKWNEHRCERRKKNT